MALKDIKGVGPRTLTLLSKIGINTVDDLVTHYPFRYELKPDEIRTLCDQFVMDNFNQLQIAILQYRIKRPTTSVDDQYCNTPNICPHGWRKSSTESEMVDMEDEL